MSRIEQGILIFLKNIKVVDPCFRYELYQCHIQEFY